MAEITITDDTTVDTLKKESRADLDDTARSLELDPDDYANKDAIAAAILDEFDGPESDDGKISTPPMAPADPKELADDPKYSAVKRWKVLTGVQYLTQRGKKKRAEVDEVIDDCPNAIAQDLFRRGALEPVLR